jgi:hypothetical protein
MRLGCDARPAADANSRVWQQRLRALPQSSAALVEPGSQGSSAGDLIRVDVRAYTFKVAQCIADWQGINHG